jgi:hypothetical protein
VASLSLREAPAAWRDSLRANLLQLDETAKTANMVFNPTTPDYSSFGGNAEVLKNGNAEYDECASTAFPANNAAI